MYLMSVLQVDQIDKPAMNLAASASAGGIGIALIALLVIGGLFLFILAGIVMYGVGVLGAIAKTLFFGTNAIATTAAGGTLLLPGINLPFLEGVLALAIVLVVHEGCHAVLARIARIPILSSGLVLFGIIPVGAFVEPDEKRLAGLEQGKQTRVIVAGPTANLLTSIAFLALFLAFFNLTASLRETGLLVYSGMEPGTVIYSINDIPVGQLNASNLSLPANSTVHMSTNLGDVTRTTDAKGGMDITYTTITRSTLATKFKIPGLEFIYTLLGLTLSLNFCVGAVNILPAPLFDGGRLIDINVKNRMIVNTLCYGTLFFLLLNFLPLLFH
jgi:membrane-associated protease RseP (regulator of RpoE activity)